MASSSSSSPTTTTTTIILIIVVNNAKDGPRKTPWKNFGMVPTWKTEKGKTSKFVDADS